MEVARQQRVHSRQRQQRMQKGVANRPTEREEEVVIPVPAGVDFQSCIDAQLVCPRTAMAHIYLVHHRDGNQCCLGIDDLCK